jgi:glyoxylase-like metal-dependent hydrolase (beta-lactamase superfamily II)
MAEVLAPGIRVVTAGNRGPMTFTGTRTYLIGEAAVAVIDPGPDDPEHAAAVLAALADAPVAAILVTHAHRDHSGGAARLGALTGAPVLGHGDPAAGRRAPAWAGGGGEGIDPDFVPDRRIGDGALVEGPGWRIEALHTPGHLGDHLAFVWAAAGALFSGDVLMGWSTTLISPPEGDLSAFMASLDRLARRAEAVFYPGHGAPLRDPAGMIAWQRAHREERTAQLVAALEGGPLDIEGIVAAIYAGLDPALRAAAGRTVLAHLVELEARGHVVVEAGPRFRLRGFHA